MLAPDVASFLRPVLERAHGGEHVEYERVDRPHGGEDRWVHGRVAPDFDPDGKLRGIYCTEYDIHDLKRTEQALATREEQLRLFTDNIPDPVVYLPYRADPQRSAMLVVRTRGDPGSVTPLIREQMRAIEGATLTKGFSVDAERNYRDRFFETLGAQKLAHSFTANMRRGGTP